MQSAFRIHRIRKQLGEALPSHEHAEGQLTFAKAGLVQIQTDRGVWMVPPQLAAWVPPDVRHRLDIMTEAELWIVYWRPSALRISASPATLDRAFALRVTPLLRALLEEAVRVEPASEKAALIVSLMLHELTLIEEAPTFLPLPSSPIGARVAELALADRQARLGIDELAQKGATSVRTVSRLFPAETGLTFKALASARPDRVWHGAAEQGNFDRPSIPGMRLREHRRLLLRFPAGRGPDADCIRLRGGPSAN